MLYRLAAIVLLAALFMPSAQAGTGPCTPFKDTLMCGSGQGAAIVVPDTISPDKKFALAWRNPQQVPTEVDDLGDYELLLVRLADGAALATSKTEFFYTGALRANRRHETAVWSPDSRRLIRLYDTRYDTEAMTYYAIAADGSLADTLDLLPVVTAAVKATMKRRRLAPDQFDFSVDGDKLALGNNGRFSFSCLMFKPKQEDNFGFSAAVAITGSEKTLRARVSRLDAAR